MPWLDIILLGALLVSALLGLWRGLIVEVMSLLSWAAAFIMAVLFGAQLEPMLSGVIEAAGLRTAVAHIGIFLLTLVAGGALTWLLSRLIEKTGLSGTDRMLGLGFGLLRGAAFGIACVLVLGLTPVPQSPAWSQSTMVGVLMPGAEWLRQQLPSSVAERVSWQAQAAEEVPEVETGRQN
ncbi:CvpA family protein [Pseudomarimonas arenosa]|uniref:CvpA family protein n=1 Tax=Pseudomarimonas arenosa TaxID=2774145 RepID=A0AAW3ZT35_9GAMM|nr:CvpA family protein [Pseudomarimonas arenosa]MBD8527321.1 CvpA family protein [Pseudomarimonas arenosa]